MTIAELDALIEGGDDLMQFDDRKIRCVYFLADDEGNVVYIGKTSDLRNRLKEHRKEKSFTSIHYISFRQDEDMERVETGLIRKCDPRLNRTHLWCRAPNADINELL